MKKYVIAMFAMLTSSPSIAVEPPGNIPTNVVSLLKSADHRYVSTFDCFADGCGYEHYIQELGFASEITCTKRIKEISSGQSTAYPVWKDHPEALYLTVVDVSMNKSFTAIITTGKNCEYSYEIEPLTRENDARAHQPGEG